MWYFFVFNILILSVSEWICVFLWEEWSKIGQKSTSILYACERVIFFSARNWLFFRVWLCTLLWECIGVLGAQSYVQFSWQQCTSENFFCFCLLSIRFSDDWKKTRKNSHLLSFKWFWRSQFYSKVVLVIRFRVCFFMSQLLSVCYGRRANLQAVLSVVGVTSAVKILGFFGRNKVNISKTKKCIFVQTKRWTTIVISVGFIL